MEFVAAREQEERLQQQEVTAARAFVLRTDRHRAIAERLDGVADLLGSFRALVHLLLLLLNLGVVAFERVANRLLEVVDLLEVGEERQQVFNAQQVADLQKFQRFLDVIASANLPLGNDQPQLPLQLLIRRLRSSLLRQLRVERQRQLHRLLPHLQQAQKEHASDFDLELLAQAERVVHVVVDHRQLLALRLKVTHQLVAVVVLRVELDQIVVDRLLLNAQRVDGEFQVFDDLHTVLVALQAQKRRQQLHRAQTFAPVDEHLNGLLRQLLHDDRREFVEQVGLLLDLQRLQRVLVLVVLNVLLDHVLVILDHRGEGGEVVIVAVGRDDTVNHLPVVLQARLHDRLSHKLVELLLALQRRHRRTIHFRQVKLHQPHHQHGNLRLVRQQVALQQAALEVVNQRQVLVLLQELQRHLLEALLRLRKHLRAVQKLFLIEQIVADARQHHVVVDRIVPAVLLRQLELALVQVHLPHVALLVGDLEVKEKSFDDDDGKRRTTRENSRDTGRWFCC